MYKIKNSLLKQIKNQIQEVGFCGVGEIHGIKENVEFYKYLIETLSIKCLALEWPESREFTEDGRVNKEMIELLDSMLDRKMIEKIIYLDTYVSREGKIDANARDETMANNFSDLFNPSLRTLLIAGNMHTQKEPFYNDFEGFEMKPLGFYLKKKYGEFPNILIRYKEGSFYNFGVRTLRKSNPKIVNELLQTGEYDYEIWIEDATAVDN